MQCATEVELWSNQTAKVNDTILIMAIRVPTASRAETKHTMGHESVSTVQLSESITRQTE